MSKTIGFIIGLLLLFITAITAPPEGLTNKAWLTAGVTLLMAAWWATEAVPVAITALLPLVLFPLLNLSTLKEVSSPYAHPIIYLLLGGFIIATAIQRWNLHQRIALSILQRTGSQARSIVAGFMGCTALLSMWISNTATTLMMMPIALSLAHILLNESNTKDHTEKTNAFKVCLVLSIVYAASIGGLGTLVGTPPNALVAAFMSETYQIEIGFAQWMLFGVPVVLVFLPLTWWILTRYLFNFELPPSDSLHHIVSEKLVEMGRITTPEKRTLLVFTFVALSWVFRPLLQQISGLENLNDTIIAIAGAVSLFLLPAGDTTQKHERLLDWKTAEKIPWSVIILFGGGLSLANQVSMSGLALWLGNALTVLASFHLIILLLCLVSLVIFLTELTSNTATTATLLPLIGALALSANYDPLLLAPPLALAASCAFMLPVATPPNAIAYASGAVTIQQMIWAGVWINIVGIIVISILSYYLIPLVFL